MHLGKIKAQKLYSKSALYKRRRFMRFFDSIKNVVNNNLNYSEEYDKELDEFNFMEEGDFLFDNEKSKTIFFYAHILSVYHDKIPINIGLARECLEEDAECFFKLIFFLRDYKYGLGRKKEFRKILRIIGREFPQQFKKYIKYVPLYGRYDDLYELFYSENESEVIKLFKETLEEDLIVENPSNLAKWLKSINASNKETRRLGKRTAELMGMSICEYRRQLSFLRKKINVLETLITNNNFKRIKYGELSDKNLIKYRKLFLQKDKERFEEFIKLSKQEKKYEKIISENYIEKYNYLKFLEEFKEKSLSTELIKNELCCKYNLNLRGEWIPAILLKNEDIISRNNYYNQSMLLTLTYLSVNSNLYNGYYLRTNDSLDFKKISTKNINSVLEQIINNSISSEISLRNLFDLLLLLKIKKSADEKFYLPEGIILVAHGEDEIKELNHENKCLDSEKIALLYKDMKEKWKDFNTNIPKLKIWLIEENYKTEIKTLENGSITIIKGSGEKVFENIIKNKALNLTNITYDGLIVELLEIINSERYEI